MYIIESNCVQLSTSNIGSGQFHTILIVIGFVIDEKLESELKKRVANRDGVWAC